MRIIIWIVLIVLICGVFSLNFLKVQEGISLAIPDDGIIPPGFYVVPGLNVMQPIPDGYVIPNADSSGNGILAPLTQSAIISQLASEPSDISSNQTGKYNALDANIQYHDSVEDITAQAQGAATTGTWVVDQSGNKRYYKFGQVATDITYYSPGSYTYGASSYVPTYEDSVYLSRTTGQSQVGRVYEYATQKLGFCANASVETAELNCRALDPNTCASTSCCVLLGGSKCVAGSETGPALRDNYADPYIKNRDFYIFDGTCYGNCDPVLIAPQSAE